jgi:hypothetical protein
MKLLPIIVMMALVVLSCTKETPTLGTPSSAILTNAISMDTTVTWRASIGGDKFSTVQIDSFKGAVWASEPEWHLGNGGKHFTKDGCAEIIKRRSDSLGFVHNRRAYNMEIGRFCWAMKYADDNGWCDMRGYTDTIHYELPEGCKWVNYCNVIPSNEDGLTEVKYN